MLTETELKALKRLSRLRLSDVEESKLLVNLQNILNSVDKLNEIDTSDVDPCSHVLEDMQAPLREDVEERLYPRDLFLGGAPEKIGALVKVPPVIKEE